MNMDEINFKAAYAAALAAMGGGANPVQRGGGMVNRLTLGTAATPFGCCNFFDRCGDGDLMSLHYAGRLPLLDYFGFNVSEECYKVMEFITYVRPSYSGGNPTAGYITDPCADPNGIEYGSNKITTEDYGRVGRLGPTRDLMKTKKYCLSDPVWRLDGSEVTSELEWDQKFVMDAVLNDINGLVITDSSLSGNGHFDGVQRWVRTGYASSMLDAIVIDWNGNPMSGGAGITWNGAAVAATYNFIDVLNAAYRRIRQRISWNQRLAIQQMNVGDMIILMPHSMIQCLLDHYTCWSVCDGAQYNEVAIQSYEARTFRTQLLGGMFGNGRIFLDGFEIPILGYDFGLIKGPTHGDIYLLTGSIGNFRVWEGQHINAQNAMTNLGGAASAGNYWQTDGGRVLWNIETDNECRNVKGWIHPRLFCKAPWANVRFQDVVCRVPGGFLSGDPTETSFYPLTSFGGDAADCP